MDITLELRGLNEAEGENKKIPLSGEQVKKLLTAATMGFGPERGVSQIVREIVNENGYFPYAYNLIVEEA